ncbi:methylated-DNA--[protein]-cysteine S-methyltransferase [Candidatus Darwinibacter acetoxidans]|nr:methylated-DNA--[protein]-cysteine S-methyltransferase [Bacillota bacterium]
MRQSVYQSPLGPFYLWFANDRLIYASFNKGWGEKFTARHFPQEEFSRGDLPQAYTHDLAAYFQGDRVEFDWPLLLLGTEFQKRVWHEISQIPHGGVTTYKRIGENLGTKAYRAVGQAVGANPVSVIIPCHRVLGTHGLGGYSGGLNVKRLLLELENVTLAPNLQA